MKKNVIRAISLVMTLLAIVPVCVHAGLVGFDTQLGVADSYAVLFEGAGNNNQLQINNGPGPGNLAVNGNIGIGGTGALSLSGPLTIDGNVGFSGTANDNGPYSGNITLNGTISGNVANVATALNNVNTLNTTLAGESGNSLAIDTSSGNQTINVSAGKSDGSGNSVFTVSSVNFGNGQTLTINGNGSQCVVLNINFSAHFAGTIVLTGGITSDQVLFNFTGGSGFTGGPTLQYAGNGAILDGIFLDPNGVIQLNSATLDGRLFGGDSQNMQIVSGGEVVAPPTPTVPDGGSTALLLTVGLGAIAFARQGLRKISA